MRKRRKSKIEFRYYKMPAGSPVLALLGEKWIQCYGKGIEYLHFHNYMEIGYCYEGQGILTIGEKDYRFSGGEFSVIPENCPHTTNSVPGTTSRWEYLYIDVEEILHELYPAGGNDKRRERMLQRVNSRCFFRTAEESPEMAGKILQVLNIMRGMEEFYLEEAKGVLTAFLVSLARENMDDAHKAKSRDEKTIALISDALDYVSDHYMEPIRIETLAGFCHISETHFRRVFSSCMQMGPLEYINLVRTQNACELLRKTNMPVSEIAYKCGFSTSSTFNRNFKQVMGRSPYEWRKCPDNFEQQIMKFKVHSEEGW